MNKGLLIVLSGPSGCGKGTLNKRLLELNKDIKLSVSATTREKRNFEQDGVDYYFYSTENFLKMIENDEFLEYAQYNGNYYGTPQKPIDDWLQSGYDVLLEIEVLGAEKVREKAEIVDIFVLPPSMEELENRLKNRNTETKEQIDARLLIAKNEMLMQDRYEYVIVNEEVEQAVNEIINIISKEKSKLK